MNSAIANDAKAAKIFIASGADVGQKNIAGATALHLASRNNSYETAKILIENGANVNERDFEGWTPLMRASLAGNQKIMNLLIENGAKIWSQNNYGETPLMHTAMADCYECGKLILENTSEQGLSNYIINNQIRQSLQIVNRRYNEPFIKLLSSNINNNSLRHFTITKSDDEDTNDTIISKNDTNDEAEIGSITQLVYIFTGKTISGEKIQEIGKNTHDSLVKEQEKNKSKKEEFENNHRYKLNSIVSEPITKEEKQKVKQIFTFKGEEKFDSENKVGNEFIDNNNVFENKKEENKHTGKYKLNSTLSKPVIEKNTQLDFNNANNKNIKFKLKNNEDTLDNREIEIQEVNNKNIYKFNSKSQEIVEKPIEDLRNKKQRTYTIQNSDNQKFSFNSSINDKKKNMKLINNNDKLNPDYIEYSLQNDDKPLNK